MSFSDLHLHTTFSDGKNSPEEMVEEAIRLGLSEIGFSDHAYTFFDERYCMAKARVWEYRETVSALREKYADRIKILLGIEQDFYAGLPTEKYDYVIGSVHYVKVGAHYVPVDESPLDFAHDVETYFGGDALAFAEAYFAAVADVVERTGADIIGHFDLISKFNDAHFFDEQDPRYVRAWQAAADKLLTYGVPFEINTGAISRGYRSFPYPAEDMIAYIKKRGGRLLLSSDAHAAKNIAFEFPKWKYLL